MNTIQSEGMSTSVKLFLILTVCIIINVILYLFEDKWIGGLFTGAWLFATLLSWVYNRLFNLNITSYSFTGLLNSFFLPILTYVIWIGVIFWLYYAQIDITENTNHSETSRNFAGVMTGFIPVLSGIVTLCYANGYPSGPAILGSIFLLFFGSFCYYLNTLRDGCDKNISNTICWTYGANVAFLCFILITALFIFLSTRDLGVANFIQFFPRTLTTNPTLPINIFSLVSYLILWISLMIVFFRHNNSFGDEEGDPVNATFTAIAIFMFFLLMFKKTSPIAKFINMMTYLISQPLSTIMLHTLIVATFILSIYYITSYVYSGSINQNIKGIQTIQVSLWLLFVCYLLYILYSYYKAP